MASKEKYLRVGTTLYKLVHRPLISRDYAEEKISWSYEVLRQDYGKNNLPDIEKYDGFCIIPNHTDYKQVYGTYLNQYEPINHTLAEGEFPYIRMFLEHIFEEQIELGLDYIQLPYTHPTQMLPIILLVSNERQTGKTTFLRFLKMVFAKNATFNTNEDFKSQFNADWANRLLILVDELLLNKMEITSLRDLMAKEIPPFLYFLLHRELSPHHESRMWFNPALLETPALNKIKKYNSSKIEIEMASYCSDVMELSGQNTFQGCPKDFLDVIRNAGLKADVTQIRNILKDNWGLRSDRNSDYTFYWIGIDGELIPMKKKGIRR